MSDDFKLYLLVGFITFLCVWRRMATTSANYSGTAYGRLGWMPVSTSGRKPTLLDYFFGCTLGTCGYLRLASSLGVPSLALEK